MKPIRLLVLWVFIMNMTLSAKAQQTAQYTQFPWLTYAINPAYAGMDGVISAAGWYRGQWAGLDGNKIAREAFVHTPFYPWSGGLGIHLSNMEAGVHAHNQLKVSYNYVKVWPSNFILSAGVAAGIRQRSMDGRKIRTPGGIYEGGQIVHDDPTLPVTLESGFAPDADIGVFVAYDRVEGGISIQQALGSRIDLQGEYPGGLVLRRTINVHGEYEFLTRGEITWSAAVWFKTDGTAYQNDILLKMQYGQNIIGGLSFRGYNRASVDALSLMGQIRLSPAFSLGYSYDITLSSLRLVSRGSHEILLRYALDYSLGQGRREKIIYSPRL